MTWISTHLLQASLLHFALLLPLWVPFGQLRGLSRPVVSSWGLSLVLHHPFTPWTQTNPLTHLRCVIMDSSWPLPPGVSVNGGTPRESFLGTPKKMHLESASDLCDLIRRTGKGCFLVCHRCGQGLLPVSPGPQGLASCLFDIREPVLC